jgi:hypothetical protein
MTVSRDRSEREMAAAAALADLDAALRTDGYRLDVTEASSDRFEITVRAASEACDDCLVPKDVMSDIVTTALNRAGVNAVGVALVYPADAHQ